MSALNISTIVSFKRGRAEDVAETGQEGRIWLEGGLVQPPLAVQSAQKQIQV